uniref:Uncharacterized protein n=1 Tax=Anguilla anguilla TaxID=7936 RepID=A0A0E9T7K9_ANGAN
MNSFWGKGRCEIISICLYYTRHKCPVPLTYRGNLLAFFLTA